MLQVAAVMAALAVAQRFVDFPLVKRMLQNAAKGSTNKLDDWVVSILYGTPEALMPVALDDAQKQLESRPEVKEKLKAEPSSLPYGLPGDMTVPQP